jgi:hypothetical protein
MNEKFQSIFVLQFPNYVILTSLSEYSMLFIVDIFPNSKMFSIKLLLSAVCMKGNP